MRYRRNKLCLPTTMENPVLKNSYVLLLFSLSLCSPPPVVSSSLLYNTLMSRLLHLTPFDLAL